MVGDRRGPGQDGFTLIEMIVVLVILGLALGLIVARGPMRSERLDIDAAAREMAGALRLARGEAIARNAPVAVVIDPLAHVYHVGDSPVRRLPAGFALSVLSPVTPAGAAAGAIVFAGDGSSSGGRIELVGRTHRVSIVANWLTGRVSVAEAR